MGKPTDKAGQPDVALLICAVAMERPPSIFEVAREAELFPLPGRNGLTMPFTQMRDKSKALFWTKACHKSCGLCAFVIM